MIIKSVLSSISVLGFFQPMIDYIFPISEQDQSVMLNEICLENDVQFSVGSYHRVSSKVFEKISDALLESGVRFKGAPGGSCFNTARCLSKAGLNVSVGTCHGLHPLFQKLDRVYKYTFNDKYLDSSSLPPSRWICLYDPKTETRTEFATIGAGKQFSDAFLSFFPSFSKYNLVFLEGFLLPFPSTYRIIEKAQLDGVPIALHISGGNFVKDHLKKHLGILSKISLLSMNLDEATLLSGETNIVDAANFFRLKMAPGGVVLITNQSKDFCIYGMNGPSIGSPLDMSTSAINSIGCGDVAFAAFILGTNCLNLKPSETANLISNFGALCMKSKDGDLPRKSILKMIEEYCPKRVESYQEAS
ncbi:carbohydrate kinase family protein [Candidatus Similichlamydia epinepheli]|uniref:carbohydrate kinase family protein n=1 Tax=Candidatus Similichlamydia epinepheli TaxID=1903953 RepID=UPI000D390F85|nr:carbohydrate kinase family protein [Candidatus Similichlamydia epinepheli]